MLRHALPPAGLAGAASAALLTCVASSASADAFAADGTWLADPVAVFVESFEDFVPAPDSGLSPSNAVDDAHALDGAKVLQAQAADRDVDVTLALPHEPGAFKASAWCRGDCIAGVAIDAVGEGPGEFSQMFPTGRMTSDGWVEFASAPFMSDGSETTTAFMFFIGASVTVDSIEVVAAEETGWEPARACEGLLDPSCDADHLCVGGWCRNTSGWVPPMPDGAARVQLADYLAARLRMFFGPYDNRKLRLPAALAETQGMKSATSRWQFWRSFATAVRRLQDSHTSVFSLADYFFENRRPLNACFVLGDADLSHAAQPADPAWPDILVSHAGDTLNWGLHAGDRLVAIDGRPPIAWMKSLIGRVFAVVDADDPASLSLIVAEMRSAIPRYARTISVLPCAASACGPLEDIDVASIAEQPAGSSPSVVSCDHRPGALVAGQPADHTFDMNAIAGPVLGTASSEKIYGLVWDDLIVQTQGATQISQAVQAWRQDGRGVILDHRTGNGGAGAPGTTASAEPIVQFVRAPTFFGVELFRQAADEEGPETLAAGLDLVDKYKATGAAWYGGSSNARLDVPVALLVAQDVSFSDIFSYAMKGAPKVRIFGPNPTNGAYSTFLGLTYASGINYQVAIGDTIGADGHSLCGHGVAPDETVMPLQSDLVAGRDTAIARALAWVRSEVAP